MVLLMILLFLESYLLAYIYQCQAHTHFCSDFFQLWKIVSVSLLHGGPGPMCFPEWLYNYWLSGGVDNLNISSDDCACPTTAKLLSKVV